MRYRHRRPSYFRTIDGSVGRVLRAVVSVYGRDNGGRRRGHVVFVAGCLYGVRAGESVEGALD